MTTWNLPSANSTPVPSIPYSGQWNQTGEADRMFMPFLQKADQFSDLTDKTVTIPITTTQKILVRQFISEPIPSQRWEAGPVTLSGPLARMIESDAGCNATMYPYVKIVSIDGTVSVTLLNQAVDTELDITTTTRRLNNAGSGGGSVSKPGDRLVLELGVTCSAPTASGTVTMRFGNPSGVALFANSSGLSTDLTPWFFIGGAAGPLLNPKFLNTGIHPRPFAPSLPR